MTNGAHNAMSLILAMSRAFGVFAMKPQGGTYVFSRKLHIYFITLTIAAMTEGVIESLTAKSKHAVSLVMVIDIFVYSFYIVTAMIVLFQHYQLRETLPAIIYELGDMERLLGNISYSRYYDHAVIFLATLNASPRIFAVIHKPFTWNHLLMRILYFSFTIIPVLISGQYAILLHILSRQLQTLSEHLNKFLFNLEVWSLMNLHHNLIVLAYKINRAFDVFLFHMITFSFVIVILKLYIVIVYIMKPDSYTDLELTTITFIDFLVICGSIIITVFAAMEATEKAKTFNAQLLKYLLVSKNFAKDEKIRTYLAMKHSIHQSACNFFSLDFNLLTSMAAGTATYVILLVQFTLL
nr:gustatory receptor 8 [Graphosoma rubrolineatum]